MLTKNVQKMCKNVQIKFLCNFMCFFTFLHRFLRTFFTKNNKKDAPFSLKMHFLNTFLFL